VTVKRFLVGFTGVFVIGAAVIAYWVWQRSRPEVVRGSPSVEFAPTQGPETPKLPRSRAVPWPTYGFDLSRTHLASGFALSPPFRRLWIRGIAGLIEFPPAVAYGRVYVAQLGGRFIALDSRTGRIVWQRRFAFCSAASPTVARMVVYEPYQPRPCNYGPRDKPGFVVAMSASTGRVLWRFRGPSSESSTLFLGGILYFGAWDHKVYALDVRTRRLRWTYSTDAEIDSSPAFHAGLLYIATNGGSVYALDARTGRLRWRSRSFSRLFGRREYFYATPTLAYGRVYIGNTDGTLYAYGAHTGHLVWARPLGTYIYSAAAVWHRTVYVGTYDGKFFAVNAATGDVRWRYDAPGAIHGAPTVMDGLVYFSTCQHCGHNGSRYAKSGPPGTYALDARTGRLVWRVRAGTYSPIVADGERVYLTGGGGVSGLLPVGRAGRRSGPHVIRKPRAPKRKRSSSRD
jgi:outer membrane protein assembly factor BamB